MDEAGKTRVGVRDLRGNLSFYLHQARQGMSFLVMSHGEAVAELRPPEPAERPRRHRRRRARAVWTLISPSCHPTSSPPRPARR